MTANANSILDSVKQVLGVDYDDPTFDIDIVMHVNTVFGTLQQLGLGPTEGFSIEDNTSLWADFSDVVPLQGLRSYICMKVKLIFDPPATSFVIIALEKMIQEQEWRLCVANEAINKPPAPVSANVVPYSS